MITGCAGFIGSNLSRYLLENENYRIIGVDNLLTGSMENLRHLLEEKRFTFIKKDIINAEFPKQKIDEIYNLACPASPVHYQLDPVHTIQTNTIGVLNVLELARANNAKILQSSTSEIYGDPLESPQNEKYKGNVNPIGIRSCYDEGKRIAETLFFDFQRKYGTKIRVARIFNTYGPGMNADDGRVVSNFIVQAIEGKDLTVYGDGRQTRSFCYVSDMVLGLVKLMNSDFTGPVNLGNPDERTVLDIAEKILNLSESKSKIVFKGLPEDDPRRRKPDITLAKEKLKWEPKIPLEEGLKKTIEYFKSVVSQ